MMGRYCRTPSCCYFPRLFKIKLDFLHCCSLVQVKCLIEVFQFRQPHACILVEISS